MLKLQTRFGKSGKPSISSKSHVLAATEDLAAIDAEIERLTADLKRKREDIKEAVDAYVLKHFKAQDGIETPGYKLTHVQGHTRTWDAAKLESLVPRGIFKNLVALTVVPAKIDEYVRAKKIDRDAIAAAYTEKPNKPYVKWSPVKESSADRAESEAAGLADALA